MQSNVLCTRGLSTFTCVILISGLCGGLKADLFINEIDYDQNMTDTAEWVEIVGTAGLSLDAYELVTINQDGIEQNTYDLEPAAFTFTDETGTGWGFFVIGNSFSEFGVMGDYLPTWSSNQIQNGPMDSIQLRLKSGPVNVHLIDYDGDNGNTTEDQFTSLADSTSADSSLYLTGNGNTFSDFSFANTVGNGTPGALNVGQTLTAIPEPIAALYGCLVFGLVGSVVIGKRLFSKSQQDGAD
jgi:hypothetical protein